MRTLHLIQPEVPQPCWFRAVPYECSGEASLLACASILRGADASDEHRVVVFGGAGAERAARRAGLRDFAMISPPLGVVSRAAPSMRKMLARAPSLDAVVCWGAGFGRLASKVRRRVPWIEVDVRTGTLRGMHGHARHAHTPSEPMDVAACGHGESSRARARARIGLREGEVAITLVSDATSLADGPSLVACSMALHVACRPAAVVLPRAVAQRERAMRYQLEGACIARAIATDEPVSEALLACDLAACVPSKDALPTSGLLWLARHAMVNSTPVIVPDHWAEHWGWPEALSPLVATGPNATSIAASMLRLLDSRDAYAEASRAARRFVLDHAPSVRSPISRMLSGLVGKG